MIWSAALIRWSFVFVYYDDDDDWITKIDPFHRQKSILNLATAQWIFQRLLNVFTGNERAREKNGILGIPLITWNNVCIVCKRPTLTLCSKTLYKKKNTHTNLVLKRKKTRWTLVNITQTPILWIAQFEYRFIWFL